MSSHSAGFTEEEQRRAAQSPLSVGYIPTEEEVLVLKECNKESFFYRSLPLSVISMVVTQALIKRGKLSASPRFGSLPKIGFAGFCGYLAGKMSYAKTCQEKFKRLENSPLGEILRQRTGVPSSKGPQSELSDPDLQSFDSMFQSAEAPTQGFPHTRDRGYGSSPEPSQMGKADDFGRPAQLYLEEEEPKRKPILYEDLRHKNRENYEVTLTQKADTMLSGPAERELERPKKEEKKNIYGDTWEE